jgi:hypothetical protein
LATHDIEVTLPKRVMRNADATITIRSDGVLLGKLHISQGSIDWRRKGYNPRTIEWEDFADALNKLASVE